MQIFSIYIYVLHNMCKTKAFLFFSSFFTIQTKKITETPNSVSVVLRAEEDSLETLFGVSTRTRQRKPKGFLLPFRIFFVYYANKKITDTLKSVSVIWRAEEDSNSRPSGP